MFSLRFATPPEWVIILTFPPFVNPSAQAIEGVPFTEPDPHSRHVPLCSIAGWVAPAAYEIRPLLVCRSLGRRPFDWGSGWTGDIFYLPRGSSPILGFLFALGVLTEYHSTVPRSSCGVDRTSIISVDHVATTEDTPVRLGLGPYIDQCVFSPPRLDTSHGVVRLRNGPKGCLSKNFLTMTTENLGGRTPDTRRTTTTRQSLGPIPPQSYSRAVMANSAAAETEESRNKRSQYQWEIKFKCRSRASVNCKSRGVNPFPYYYIVNLSVYMKLLKSEVLIVRESDGKATVPHGCSDGRELRFSTPLEWPAPAPQCGNTQNYMIQETPVRLGLGPWNMIPVVLLPTPETYETRRAAVPAWIARGALQQGASSPRDLEDSTGGAGFPSAGVTRERVFSVDSRSSASKSRKTKTYSFCIHAARIARELAGSPFDSGSGHRVRAEESEDERGLAGLTQGSDFAHAGISAF
ncbi:hypothetical protein DFH09DRAFT_1092243 [Mycena vulgaris]|nr:hypothetical protein DFH09DRAFT_1092243 [Mycena vulgaris]